MCHNIYSKMKLLDREIERKKESEKETSDIVERRKKNETRKCGPINARAFSLLDGIRHLKFISQLHYKVCCLIDSFK